MCGVLVIRAMPERKRFFSADVFPKFGIPEKSFQNAFQECLIQVAGRITELGKGAIFENNTFRTFVCKSKWNLLSQFFF